MKLAMANLILAGCSVLFCGCEHFHDLSHDPYCQSLLGRRCVATNEVSLPKESPHFLPRVARGYGPPKVSFAAGTVFRVIHVEAWYVDFVGASAWGIFAVAENGAATRVQSRARELGG